MPKSKVRFWCWVNYYPHNEAKEFIVIRSVDNKSELTASEAHAYLKKYGINRRPTTVYNAHCRQKYVTEISPLSFELSDFDKKRLAEYPEGHYHLEVWIARADN